MNYVGRFIGNLKGFYSGINGATLTGAIDVVVVEQEDGTYKCSPFHVRFGKLGVLRSKEKVVDIEINGEQVPIRMKLGDSGEAFFVQEVDGYDDDDAFLATSPLPASPQLSDSDQRTKIGEDSDEGKIILQRTIEPLMLAVQEEAAAVESENQQGRKKRRRKRRNQGSRGNIVLEPVNDVDQEQAEPMDTMFKMDEELSQSSVASDKDVTAPLMSQSRSYHRDFYSDTEVDVTGSAQNSRPSTPVQSDSEYEISKAHIQKVDETEEVGKWPWGELPSTGTNTPAITPLVQADGTVQTDGPTLNPEDVVSSDDEGQAAGKPSIMGRLFPFMAKRHSSGSNATANAPNESPAGVYLDDLNFEKMDPEVAALYFPKFDRDSRDTSRQDKDDDAESGKGSSLPQSPAPGSPRSSMLSSFMEDGKSLQDVPIEGRFEAISICGNPSALFEQCQLTYDELCENPEIVLKAPPDSIFVKMDGKTIPWAAALPHLLSTAFFKRPLPPQLYDRLVSHYVKTEDPATSQEVETTAVTTTTTVVAGPPALPQSFSETVSIERSNSVSSTSGRRYSSWLPWRRSQNSPEDQLESPTSPTTVTAQGEASYGFDVKPKDDADSTISTPSSALPSPYAPKARHNTSSSSSDESESGAQEGTSLRTKNPNVSPTRSRPVSLPIGVGGVEKEKYKKSLRLTTEQVKALNLQPGRNEATFSVTTAYQGTTVARCHIYLWRYDDRIVVSDIDGTITKSDVLGHILPIIGQDWAQSGVAQLFTQIQHNGYKMLYLSARAIGQAQTTREYLRSIKQGDVTLPDGPLFLNPTSLMSALHREVIEKKPEEFKIACLRDIQTLFPTNPLYAGYGNKINDVFAYRAVEIAVPRIFTINHKGELRHALTNTFQSSYTSLVELAEYIFPPYKVPHLSDEGETMKHSVTMTDGYSHFEFWRTPVSDIPDEVKVETITKSTVP